MSCKGCGETISTNALARASHERGVKHNLALEKKEDEKRAQEKRVKEAMDAYLNKGNANGS